MIIDLSLEVLGSDTDQNGHMNHVRYIYYLEQARHTWYNGIGMPVRTLIEEQQVGTAVVHLETDFKKRSATRRPTRHSNETSARRDEKLYVAPSHLQSSE
ncbi:acyl-CoA thioesterase [Kurthia massiliensis]|uniref:acyl-CoA thioesterase n=1 Tax=Kurthia massiliensis TaxID=1033739 RepID=UPI000289C91C|nr:acyl-CoA thioesterase [Kurthia massiliensis]